MNGFMENKMKLKYYVKDIILHVGPTEMELLNEWIYGKQNEVKILCERYPVFWLLLYSQIIFNECKLGRTFALIKYEGAHSL